MKKIRILIADDHTMVRVGLTSLLGTKADLEVVGEAANGEQAVTKAIKLEPDVVIMDLMMPKKDGVEASAEIHARKPGIRILLLTTFGSSGGIAKALESGATGAILKSISNTELFSVIRKTAAGVRVLSPEIEKMIEDDRELKDLSPRQLEILQSLARGLTNREIALQYNISADSVKTHITRIFNKLGVASRSEAVSIALRKHLLKI